MIVEVPEEEITRIIIKEALEDWVYYSECDAIIVGAGPSGLTAAYYIAQTGAKTLVLDRRLSPGGGIGGGGNLFHKIVVASPADEILRDIGARYKEVRKGVYVLDAAELIGGLFSAALRAGAKVIFGVHVEDVIYRTNPLRISGVVVTWSAISLAQLHVDPICLRASAVIDATGHDAEIVSIVSKKVPGARIRIMGGYAMNAPEGERFTVEKSGEVMPGLFVVGMATNTTYGGPRMGPIFSAMLLSGRKVAELVIRRLEE